MTAQLSRERLEEIASYEIGAENYPRRAEWMQMARMLLAGMSSDPVGVFNIGNETCPDHLVAWTAKGQNLPNGVYWLHIAPPAAVIPEGWEPCSPEWIDRNGPCSCGESPRIAFGTTGTHYHPHIWQKPAPVAVPDDIRNRLKAEGVAEVLKDAAEYAPLTAGQWETLTNNWHQTFLGLSGDENACRAAMLKAGPVTAATVPDGWKLVPVEPTKEMIDAGWSYYMTTKSPSSLGVYGAMLAAAPEQEV